MPCPCFPPTHTARMMMIAIIAKDSGPLGRPRSPPPVRPEKHRQNFRLLKFRPPSQVKERDERVGKQRAEAKALRIEKLRKEESGAAAERAKAEL